nr:golgin subfamily B member 1 [Pogona vitticeps]
MLSRLSGLANTVLHELSGDGEDAGSPALPVGTEPEAGQQNGEEATEDVLERLAHMERLVVQLKDLVREKDTQLWQKDAQLQDERQAAEAKLLKLKLQAKAKLASLNKRIEELTERGAASPASPLPGEPASPAQVESEQRPQDKQEEEEEETEGLRRRLREQEEAAGKLQEQLQAATESLSHAQAQLTVLQEEVQEKETQLREQAHQHQTELQQLMAPSALEVEMQQNLRLLQQKLEEQEAALLGRTQVVELLQQELNALEEQRQALLEKFQKAEAEADSLRNTLTSERQESQSRAERLELELAEQKMAFHRLQEEVQEVAQELAQARAAQADLERKSQAAEQRHAGELAQKGQEIAELQKVEQDLRSCYEALRDENAQLRQDLGGPTEASAEDAPLQQGELPEKPQGPGLSQAEAEAQEAGQVIPLESQPVSELSAAASPGRDGGQQEGRQHEAAGEAPGPETGITPVALFTTFGSHLKNVSHSVLCCQQDISVAASPNPQPLPGEPAMLEKSPGFGEGAPESNQVGGAETTPEEPPQLLELQGSLERHKSERGEEDLPLSEAPSAPAQPTPCESPRELPHGTENSPTDILEYLSQKKHKDLSVLLLELQEAQEEIAFLKGQLPVSSQLDAEGAQQQPREPLQDSGGERGGEEGLALIQSDSSSSSLVTVDVQEDSPPLVGTLQRQDSSCAEDEEGAQKLPPRSVLPMEGSELRTRQQEAEELHKRALEEREVEIQRLRQLLEDSDGTLRTLRAERDELLSRLEELCSLAELKAQVRQLEGDLADAEKRRLSDYEDGLSRLGLLKEEIQSLNNEARSKEVKISALQKDLDEAQCRLAEQDRLAKSLSGQLQKAEQEQRSLVGQLQAASAEAEELSRRLTSEEQESARLERLLSESARETERLRQQVAEREEQMAEVSRSMSDRMVQLNEEKFLLGKELQSLTERLSLQLQEKPTRDQSVGTEEEEEGEAERPDRRAVSAGQEMEALRKENEQVRKKLQAALVSRKELLSRVRQLERELEEGRRELAKPGVKGQDEEEEEEDGKEEPLASGRDAGGEAQPAGRGQEPPLSPLLSAKETELQAALEEKESAVASLQAAVAELQQSLKEKDLWIGALQAELKAQHSAPGGQTSMDQSTGLSETAAPLGREQSSAIGLVLEEETSPKAGLEERLSVLKQEKEQLQKKLQEALASRKDTLKKAQEKDRHHREQLRQQKEDYSVLQEQLEQQMKAKERLQDQLQALSTTLENSSLPEPAKEVPSEGGPAVEVSPECVLTSEPLATEGLLVEQLKADLERLRDEKKELENHASNLEGELAKTSATIRQLQEQSRELLAELEGVKGACSQAEARAASLRQELDQSRAEVARLENLRLRQVELEEGKARASKEEIESLNSQLAEKCESVRCLQAQLQERENTVKVLQGQLEIQSREQAQQHRHVEAAEAQQKAAEEAAEGASRAQLQRKLQAALISRKEALKESKMLKEELSSTKAALESASARLLEAESQASELEKEKGALLEKLAVLGEEREKLIAEVDRALVENQSVSSSCESLKLALERVTQEKTRWEEEVGTLQQSHAQALSEGQEKHQELQKEYETLLQSYENISDEAERIQRVVESVRQEKQELFLRLKDAEAEKREVEARLQGAEQEMEGMREKMRKFAKSKQQKILELEEENERLRADGRPAGDGSGGAEEASAHLRGELESAQRTCESLSCQLEALLSEKEALSQQIQDLRRSAQTQAEGLEKSSQPEESCVASEAVGSARARPPEAVAAETHRDAVPEPLEPTTGEERGPSQDEINGYLQQVAQLSEQVAELEEKRKAAAEEMGQVRRDLETLGEEKRGLEELLAARGHELHVLQEKVLTMERAGQQAEEQRAEARRLKEALEAEKDDLEERLMNQLAELNGSIGNYQQEVVDLQSQNQQLRSEVESLRETLSQLEEEQRRLPREKSEAEAEKKIEREEKQLQSCRKGDNSRTQVKELQELLKEKQQEVRQLQKDCIKSQERISSLERTIKALEFVQSESKKELGATQKSLAQAEEGTRRAQAELASCRVLLDDTQSEAARVLAESLKAKEELHAYKARVQAELRQKEKDLERRLEQEKGKHSDERRSLEEKLEALRREQAGSEGRARDLQESLRRKDQEAQQLQGSLNHTLAQLAAFTRSMSSLQDDRDRVIDESRQWEKKFSEALEKKEQEVQAREEACAALEAEVKQGAAQVEELQTLLASLEQDKLARESSAQKQLQQHQEEVQMLQKEKEDLASQLEETRRLLSQSQDRVQKQEAELGSLREELSRLQESLAQSKAVQEGMEETVKSQEADLQECRFRREQLEADLQASKALTDRLHQEASAKDQKIIRLLAAQEEAVAAAASEWEQKHQEELARLEDRRGRAEAAKAALETEKKGVQEKADHLAERLKSAREESQQLKAQLDSFTKSMSSLQDDRDRVLEDYQQLEQRHLAAILEKDRLIQEEAAENNTLKEELRSLHGRLDDLHAENAKLDAELVRYRQDLNQVISIKDCQQKQLLKTQLEHLQALEKEKAGVEGQLRESERALASLRLSVEDLQREKDSVEQEGKALKDSLSWMENEMAALREGGPVLELQAQLQGKVDEAQALSGQLSLAQQRTRELEAEVASLQKTMAQRVQEAEAKMKKELKDLHHDAGLMRNETETAEERVAELAKDLLEMEQNLLAVTEENQDLKAQIQSFQKAMSSLQDSWDQAHEELRALEKKYSGDMEEQRLLVQSLSTEKARLQEEQTRLSGERDALASELAALRSAAEEKGLLARLDLLGQQLQAKDVELLRLASELEGASGQVKSFSKALASLQGERDRLLSTLDKARREEELQLQSTASASASLAEVPSLKRALSALQDDRDRLLAELKNLQQQYLQAGVDTAEITRLTAELQEQQREVERQQSLQEQLKAEAASLQLELQQLREEKAAWESEAPVRHEQPLRAAQKTRRSGARGLEEDRHQRQAAAESSRSTHALKGEAPGQGVDTEDLQAQLQSSLKELHQKELRIQQLHSKLSQVFEEKNSLSLQLRGSSGSLRESQQRFRDVLARCEALEKRLQEAQTPGKGRASPPTDAAPGGPQERSEPPRESYTPELQELQMKLSEAKQQQSQAKEGLLQLEELLQEERGRRLAAEEAFSTIQDHVHRWVRITGPSGRLGSPTLSVSTRLESAEWSHSAETSVEIPLAPEHQLLVGPSESSFSKARGGTGLRRVLRSLFCSRRRLPWLATIYLLTVHALLLLCFTGHL